MTTPADDKPLDGCCVLLVEDEALVAMLMEEMLFELGAAAVRLAGNVPDAVAKAASPGLALSILDINLGGTPSYPAAAALRANGVPFLFVTGYGPAGVDPAWADVPVLQKPVSVVTLASACRARLAQRS